VQATCVARIIVAKDKMPEFAAAIQKNLERFMEMEERSNESSNSKRKSG